MNTISTLFRRPALGHSRAWVGGLALAVSATLLAAPRGNLLTPDTSFAAIERQGRRQPAPVWRIPLGQCYVENLALLDGDRLLVGLKSIGRGLPNEEALLVNIRTGQVMWRMPREKDGQYVLLGVAEGLLFMRVYGAKQGLVAYDVATGAKRWQYDSKQDLVGLVPVPERGLVVVQRLVGRRVEVIALGMSDGRTVWSNRSTDLERGARPASLTLLDDVLLVSSEGLHRLQLDDGARLWSRPEIRLGADDPPPQRAGDRIVVACGRRLLVLEAGTGRTHWEVEVEAQPTNLIPLGDSLYVRGELPYRDPLDRFTLAVPLDWPPWVHELNLVCRFQDPRTGSFILIIYQDSSADLDATFDLALGALKGLAVGSLRTVTGAAREPDTAQRRWRVYQHDFMFDDSREFVTSCVGAIRTESGAAVGFLGFIRFHGRDETIEQVERAFDSLMLKAPQRELSVAERWQRRAEPRGDDRAARGRYEIRAHRLEDGTCRWRQTTAEPTVSNLIERDGRVYTATGAGVVCLDASSGRELFVVELTNTGRTFPVRLHLYGDRLIFVSELMIAGLDAATGENVYTHGFTPLSQANCLNGLDQSIPEAEDAVAAVYSIQPVGTVSGMLSSLKTAESRTYQNLATQYRQDAAHQRSLGGDSSLSSLKSSMASSRANLEAQAAFVHGVIDLAAHLFQMIVLRRWQQHFEDLLARQQLFRRSILLSSEGSQDGDFVSRPHRQLSLRGDGDFATIALVHMPSGRRRDVVLSPSYLDYGLWNALDVERGLVIHQGIGLDPSFYQYGKAQQVGSWGKVRTLNSYLIAMPVRLGD